MIMEKNNDTFRYVAAACFGINTILVVRDIIVRIVRTRIEFNSSIIDAIRFEFNPWELFLLAGYVLIAVSLFTSISILTTAGGAALAIYIVRERLFYIWEYIILYGKYFVNLFGWQLAFYSLSSV